MTNDDLEPFDDDDDLYSPEDLAVIEDDRRRQPSDILLELAARGVRFDLR